MTLDRSFVLQLSGDSYRLRPHHVQADKLRCATSHQVHP